MGRGLGKMGWGREGRGGVQVVGEEEAENVDQTGG